MDYAEKMTLTASACLLLAIIVWVNNFLTPKIQADLNSEGNEISQVVVIWVVGKLNVGV